MTDKIKEIHIIGAGLAGTEAAYAAAQSGVPVVLHEMRPKYKTDAHKTGLMAELVCSNSLRSDDHEHNAVGLLHEEMRLLNSLTMRAASLHKLPAGGALAVDREGFAQFITEQIKTHPLIQIIEEEITGLPPDEWDEVIIATGPLTSASLGAAIRELTGEDGLAFSDAIAPIVYKETMNMDVAWMQSRYDKQGPGGTGKDYINCPLSKEQYERFIAALLASETSDFKEWEKSTPYFNGCLPIEVMAARGPETLRHGPMKPVGLTNQHNPTVKPYAIVQLRQDNALATLYNIVGFQTKMKYGAQAEILRMIPGLEQAEFARLGGLHRNTFLNSPKLLDDKMRLKMRPALRFAGQITGVEGYVESAAMGALAGRMAAFARLGKNLTLPPITTAHGALLHHITQGHSGQDFQPMNINFGLMPEPDMKLVESLAIKDKSLRRKRAYTLRAMQDFKNWLSTV